MGSLLARFLINAIALFVAAYLTNALLGGGGTGVAGPGADGPAALVSGPAIEIRDISSGLIAAFIFGVVNALIRPIVSLVTCPLQILTLGLFTLVINALMLLLTSAVAGWFGVGFVVHGFLAAFIGAIIISIVSTILSHFVP